ncbi:hypothetical protein CDN99_22540 [Roseateles aquatilis]|uniref:DUF1840 domain-containing protein n=1 Tax=Roseateles aquatilis TaxID=431061 RepID=A0A2D0AM60_9BURK|nr:DUF1840 domain-containing protein [Roseateles aquatilis]OWQ85313.1 hypothetical protein CDN99_22540 [Roseateles aquatilis]
MLYKFKSKAGADVIMLAAHGDQALQALGRDPAPQGILQSADLASLIAHGEAAIAQEQQAFDRAAEEARAEDRKPPPRPEVTLRQRLWPLLELMRAAQVAGTDVVWGV